jgi:hypothetical protein
MKKIILLLTACISILGLGQAKDCLSPDRRFAVRADQTISLVNLASGEQLLMFTRNTTGLVRVEVAWSPDSRKVAIAEDYQHGSGIVAAWLDGQSWHKTLEMDADAESFIKRLQQQFGGPLVAENVSFDGWSSEESIRVKGILHFRSGRSCNYTYTLYFLPSAVTHLDRGGYEVGKLVGKDFRVL